VKLNRRLLLAASAAAIPVVARAQELAQDRKKIVVGLLSWWPPFMEPTYVDRLREGLKAFGYVEGRNLELLVTFTGGNVERAREAAKAYVDRGVDVIVATATPAVTIAKQATEAKKIPIVMTPVSDPIATGFAASIARPGGHLTGMSMVGPDLSGKRLGFLREIMPDLKSIAFIGWTRDQNTKTFVSGIEAAAAQLGIKLVVKLVDAPSEIDDKLMAALKQDGVQAVVVQPIFMGHQDRIIRRPDGEAADRQRFSGVRPVRRPLHLRHRRSRADAACRLFHRPHRQGREPRRPADRTADRLRADRQPEDGS
jgi:putative ABC transport system substrate-binding protein